MIRVLQVLGGLDRGGAETLVMNLYRVIDRSKIQFDFVTHTPGKQAYYEEILALGGKIYYFPRFTGTNIKEVRKEWENFFETHTEYHILHSHVRSYAAVYLRIAHKYNVKTIIHSHNTSNGSGVSAIAKKVLQFPLRFSADYYFGCSREAGLWLFGEKIVRSNKYYMLKNGVLLERFAINDVAREKIRTEFGISTNMITIGTVGRLTPQKNPDFIIDICSKLKQKNFEFHFVWVGVGELREHIERTIREKKLDDVITMTGMRSDVQDIMQALDLFVLPSLFEGLPVVAVEAQAAGLNTFVSDTITKDVKISENIKYIPIDDTNKWINAIMAADYKKKDVSDCIKDSGFDIRNSAQWLTDFYLKIE